MCTHFVSTIKILSHDPAIAVSPGYLFFELHKAFDAVKVNVLRYTWIALKRMTAQWNWGGVTKTFTNLLAYLSNI